jgi:uncharacterized protein YggT (Ycf19 family)
MSLIDFILNVAGLLLWLNWRAAESPVKSLPGAPLISPVRPAGPLRPRFSYWVGVPVLLVVRAVFYWQVGRPVGWIPQISLGPITLSFRSDLAGRMFLFSLLSFGVTLGIFYTWLLLLSWLNERVPNTDPIQRLVRAWLGRLERWPGPVKLFLPGVAAAVIWSLLNPLLAWLNIVPSNPWGRLLEQGAVIGLADYLTVKFLVIAVLVLYLFNSYLYLGEFVLWKFVHGTARRLMRPIRRLPLHAGKIDLTPLVFIALVLLVAELMQRGLAFVYQRLL